jgi:HEAT repeat protein
MFGFFGKKPSEDSGLRKLAERAANKRAQPYDRWEAIQALSKMKTPAAIEALLSRFSFYVDSTITDQEEKDAVFGAIIEAGSDVAMEPVTRFLKKSESISWPVKILDRIASPEQVVAVLIALLAGMDTEYERDPQRKIQMLATLEERQDPRVVDAAARFVQDANETVRFHGVGAVLAQPEAEQAKLTLLDAIVAEDSVRVRSRILDAFAERGWSVGERAAEIQKKLPSGYSIDKQGVPRKV